METYYAIAAGILLWLTLALLALLLLSYRSWTHRDFLLHEAMHALRKLHMRCPICDGGGTLAMPGATVTCTFCGESRRTLQWIAGQEQS